MDRYILQTYQRSCDEKCHVEMESTLDDLRKTKLACTIQIFNNSITVHQDCCYVIQSVCHVHSRVIGTKDKLTFVLKLQDR